MGNVCVCVCARAPTGEMLPCWSPRQAGLRVPWHAPCVLAHGPILGIQVWLGGGGGAVPVILHWGDDGPSTQSCSVHLS